MNIEMHSNLNIISLEYFKQAKSPEIPSGSSSVQRILLIYINTVLSVYFWHSKESPNIKTYQRIEFTRTSEEQPVQVQGLSDDATTFRRLANTNYLNCVPQTNRQTSFTWTNLIYLQSLKAQGILRIKLRFRFALNQAHVQ